MPNPMIESIWFPLAITLKVSIISTLIVTILGIFTFAKDEGRDHNQRGEC